MTFLTHSARKLDADGQIDDFWFAGEGDTITAVGTGDGWQKLARTGVAPADILDAAGYWLTPGFIDLHGHGGGGFAFDDDVESIEGALATHRAHGTTRSLISLVANPVARLRSSLEAIAALTVDNPLVLGSHLEGPFLAPTKRGAHHPTHLLTPDKSVINDLLAASDGTLRQVTIAPELPGGLDAIDQFTAAGVVVGVGHTEADYGTCRAAFDRGARLLTHAFNAMPGIQHREPGPIIAAFEDDRVTIELILDGLHVHPDVARLTFRAAAGRVALITDAMAAAGSVDGDYRLGDLNVTVTDGKAVLRGTNTIAGSTLTQDVALRVAIERAHIEPAAAVEALTLVPARSLGLADRLGLLRPGFAADAVLLDDAWRVQSVRAAGVLRAH